MTSSQINDQLGAAVRDGVARAAGAVGWRGSGLIHLLDPPSKLNETPPGRRESAVPSSGTTSAAAANTGHNAVRRLSSGIDVSAGG
jgi:hypothetical protein